MKTRIQKKLMGKRPLILSLLILTMISFCVNPSFAAEVKISAAASLTEVLKQLAVEFKKTNPDVSIQFNFGSSGSLAKQVSNGAPIDIFVSANDTWMDYLVKQGKISPKTVRILARNTLVFVGPKGSSVKTFADLTGLKHIALGSPKSVPAGEYAEQALKAAGIYDNLVKQNILVMAKDVRQALTYADHGDTDGAFVYQTDALQAQKAVILFSVPDAMHDKIIYPLALTSAGEINESAKLFYKFTESSAAADMLKKQGFIVPIQEK